jgi:hypothetical protein
MPGCGWKIANFLAGHTLAPQIQNSNATTTMSTSRTEYKRQLGVLEHCLLLGRLYYDEGKSNQGEYYLNLAKQYYQEIVEEARINGEALR